MKIMQKHMTFLGQNFLAMALLLCVFPFWLNAATYEITVSDHWRDVLVGNRTEGYSVNTTGGCTVLATLPMNAPQIFAFPLSTNSHVELMLGSFDTIFYLRDDPNYKPGSTSVSIQENNPTTGALLETIDLDWGSGMMNISATMNFDAIGGESAYGTQGQAGVTDISDQINFYLNIGNRDSYTENYLNISGKNTDFEVTDPLGNPQSLEAGSVTGTKIISSPIISIETPAVGAVVEGTGNGKVHFSGTVAGISPLASVSYYLNGDTNNEFSIIDSFASDVRSASWSTIIDLTNNSDAMPGTNALDVVVYDIYGGWESRSRTIFYVFTNTVNLQVTGQGSIAGLSGSKTLNIGENYLVTAKPSPGWFLENWTDGAGNILSQQASFHYQETNEQVLTANFVPNPFVEAQGDYIGLFYDTNNGVSPVSAGAVALTVDAEGGFSGEFRLGAKSYPLSGQFELASNYAEGDLVAVNHNRAIRNGLPPFLFDLQLNVDTNLEDPGAGLLGGSLATFTDFSEQQTLWSSFFMAKRSSYDSNDIPPGLDNIVIPPLDPTGVSGPGGDSFGAATVAKTGGVGFVLNLADGTTPTVSFASALAADGSAPFYAYLYGGQGVMLGWFDLSATNAESPGLSWLKLPTAGKYYPAGFFTNPPAFVSRYIPPGPGTNIFGANQVAFTAEGANLASNVTAVADFNYVKNTFSVPAPDSSKLSLKFAPATGLITGTFMPLRGKPATTFKAAFIPAQTNAVGFFSSTNETGGVILVAQ
jgi:Divergent InlB B-repeat domain